MLIKAKGSIILLAFIVALKFKLFAIHTAITKRAIKKVILVIG